MNGKRFSKLTLRVLATGLLSASVMLSPASAFAQQSSVHNVMQQYADQLHNAGVSGVLAEARGWNSTTDVRAGVGNRQIGTPVPWQGHFRTGSTTKTFVATVMLQLVAENKISLDDSVEKWLPGVLDHNGYDGSRITVRELLNHTSGIFDYTSDDAFFATLDTPEHFYANRFKNYTPEQLIAIGTSHPPEFAPGTSWDYSSTNYIIAGQIIKAVTGRTWDKEVKDRIITPLGLSETTTSGNNPFMPVPFARAYHIYTDDPAHRAYTDTTTDNLSWGGSAGDIITTVRDENRFFRALLQGKLLPAPQLAAMKTVVPVDETFSYGLGLMWMPSPCDSKGIWGHDGGTVGYSTSNGVTDDGSRSIVVSLSTTTFTDLDYVDATIPLRNGIVTDTLCYGQPTTQKTMNTQPQSTPISSKRSRIRL